MTLYAKADIAAKLAEIQHGLTNDVAAMTPDQFERSTGAEWSAADYLKHLILSVKPFARVLGLPADKQQGMFSVAERPSVSYAELVARYEQRIAEGARAEMSPAVTPIEYRLPADMTDLKSTLSTAWNEGNDRLLAALAQLDEDILDAYQLPHPALGMITPREMLYFTVHHNALHWRDIQRVGQ